MQYAILLVFQKKEYKPATTSDRKENHENMLEDGVNEVGALDFFTLDRNFSLHNAKMVLALHKLVQQYFKARTSFEKKKEHPTGMSAIQKYSGQSRKNNVVGPVHAQTFQFI